MKKKILVGLLVFVALFTITGCGEKKEETSQPATESSKSNENEENTQKDTSNKNRYMHDYFDVNKFDKNKFSGIVYDKDGKEYKVDEVLSGLEVKEEYYRYFTIGREVGCYYLTNDKSKESKYYTTAGNNPNNTSDEDLEFIKDVLGNPSAIYEKYSGEKSTGDVGLVYDYDNYVILIHLHDFSHWENYPYTSPFISYITVESKATWFSDSRNVGGVSKLWYKDHKLYGKEVSK